MTFVLKLLMAPVLIAVATLAGRRWGPGVSGWLIGFPFISAPISMILAIENGPAFAAQAATGTLGGQACVCLFSTAYLIAAHKFSWWFSAPLAILAFFGCAVLWSAFSIALLPALALLLVLAILLLVLVPRETIRRSAARAPWWDVPARMIIAVVFVAALTHAASTIGPQRSGLFSAFPIMGTILACFTHAQQGSRAVTSLLRGSILGSFAIAAFYLVVGVVLPFSGNMLTYLLAAVASILAGGITLRYANSDRAISRPQE